MENIESVKVINNNEPVEEINNKKIVSKEIKRIADKNKKIKPELYINSHLIDEVSIILPINNKFKITEQFVNIIELAVYQKKLQNPSFTIDLYEDANDLQKIIQEK